MRGTVAAAGCALAWAAAFFASGCERGEDYPRRTVEAGFLESAQRISAGEALFMRHCASCHGTVAEGRMGTAHRFVPPPSDFSDPKYRAVDPAYLYWRIEQGNRTEPYRSRGSVMPAWGPHLDEEAIWSLVAYIRAR